MGKTTVSKVLVTGAAGFIGSSLTDKLLDEGFFVLGVDNFDPFYPREIKEKNLDSAFASDAFVLIEADIRDKESLRSIFSNNEIDLVVHLAAKAGVRPSIANPSEYFDVNVTGTQILLEVMNEFEVKKLVFASSSSVYGNNKKVPFSEDDSVDNPISPYAATKKSGELACHAFHHLYGFDVVCLRFFTVFGPRQRPDLAIHKFTDLILQDKSIPVYGNGETERDYTYISDIVEGILSSINQVSGYEIINLGESRTIKLSALIELLEKTIGKQAIINRLDIQAGDVSRTFADISKAQQVLGYTPKVTKEEGLTSFVQWKLKQPEEGQTRPQVEQ